MAACTQEPYDGSFNPGVCSHARLSAGAAARPIGAVHPILTVVATLDKSAVRSEYNKRLAERTTALAVHDRRERRIADARLGVAIVGLVIAWQSLWAKRIEASWLALPVLAFVALLIVHERARRARRKAERAAEFYRKGLARLDDRWAGSGEPGSRFLNPEHPYAADLDVFGTGSLFERLCTARTRSGEEALAGWLLGPATPEEIHKRHAAIDELRCRLDLREDLELLGGDVRAGIEPEALIAWGNAPRALEGWFVPVAAAILAPLAVATLVYWLGFDGHWQPFIAIACLEIAFTLATVKRVRRVLTTLDRRAHDLALLSALLARIENEPGESPPLVRLREALGLSGETASHQIARLARYLKLLDWMRNQIFAPIGALVLWTPVLARAVDAWRGRSGPAIAGWLAAAGEFEALGALAAYAFENPDDPFPTFAEDGACFQAEAVGHPLIAEESCVRNDVRLGGELRVLSISGSNMSGKSTLLRTVGINTVMALAGAPVRARRLHVAPMAVGATLRVQDSLQAGRSRFYAEITRVRQLVDLAAGPLPLLFLLDELFNGTNSHDRRIGAEAVIRGLVDRGAIGLITTHDLSLAEIADALAPRAVNVHFEDHFENGTMHFDYRVRAGVVRKSNALELMRAVGLEV